MKDAHHTYYRALFRSAALFNWAVGAVLILAYQPFFSLIDMPPVQAPVFLHLFALLVVMFGLGYYWISLNPTKERSLIMLGSIAKSLVFLTCLIYYFLDQLTLPFLLLSVVDLLYSLSFAECLIRQSNSLNQKVVS